jgi:hypothetical protein
VNRLLLVAGGAVASHALGGGLMTVDEPVPDVPDVPGEAQGWYVDPFGRHELRWFSEGAPTALVRDGGTDGEDPPPQPTWDGALQHPPEVAAVDETLRAGVDPELADPDEAGHLFS